MKKYIFVSLVFLGLLKAGGVCEDKTFSFYSGATDGTTIGELLVQLSNECGYSMIMRDDAAKNKLADSAPALNVVEWPLEKIFDLLLTEHDLNYEFDGKILRISYLMTETFRINYIGTARTGESSTDITLSQGTSSGSSSGSSGTSSGGSSESGTADSVSGTKIKSTDDYNFWDKIEKEIFEITFRPGDEYRPNKPASLEGEGNENDGATADNNVKKANTSAGIQGQAVVVNKAAGFISITGTIKQIERARKYIKDLEAQLQNQVLIDVNILTVTHNNGNTVGVDWNQVFNLTNFNVPNQQQGDITAGEKFGPWRFVPAGMSFNRVLELLATYGTVRSVSNPKVLTLSNQPALISVGSILRYKKTSSYLTATSGTSSTTTDEDYPSVFAGVLLDITPSIQGEYIMLKINPSITKTKDTTVENQATALLEPPNLSASQLSSLIRAKDGDKIVIGGLINKNATVVKNRVPFLGHIPLFKYVFSYDSQKEETTEMVIVITPHIVKRNDNPSLQDLGYSENVNEIIKTGDVKANIEEVVSED
ncbi:secretin N-terminal domain-containing protein [Helicobacter sp. 23-1044]